MELMTPQNSFQLFHLQKKFLFQLGNPNGLSLRGCGLHTTLIHKSASAAHMLKPSRNFMIKDLVIEGNKSTQTNKVDTIYYDGAGGGLFKVRNILFKEYSL
jgi:hypothetical protein